MTPIDRLTDALASAQRNNLVHAGTMVLTDDLAAVLAVVAAAQRLLASPATNTTLVSLDDLEAALAVIAREYAKDPWE